MSIKSKVIRSKVIKSEVGCPKQENVRDPELEIGAPQ